MSVNILESVITKSIEHEIKLQSYKGLAENYYEQLNMTELSKKKGHGISHKFFYINCKKMNGKVHHSKNFDFILLNTGLIGGVYNFFYSAMCDPLTYPKIGYIECEKSSGISNYDFDKKNIKFKFDNIPNDITRKFIVEHMAMFALRFAIFHELAHHFNGHVFYLKEKKGEFELSITGNDSMLKVDALDYQTLEMDADAFAINNAMCNAIGLYEDANFLPNAKDRMVIFELLAFSIHCFFLLLDDDNEITFDINKHKHLPAKNRQALIMSAAARFFKEYSHMTVHFKDMDYTELIWERLIKGMRHAEECYNRLTKKNHQFAHDLLNNEDLLKYTEKVLRNWEKLRPELEKYARTVLFTDDIDISKCLI